MMSYLSQLKKEAARQNRLLEIRPSTIKEAGEGVFARVALSSGTDLGYYRGQVFEEWPEKNNRDHAYFLQISHRPSWITTRGWSEVRHPLYIDGDNILSKINCCRDEAWRQNAEFGYSGRFTTTKSVEEGAELFIHYGPDYWSDLRLQGLTE
jgi:hypothetical protein